MEIIDLRPAYERLLTDLWSRTERRADSSFLDRLLGRFTTVRVGRRRALPARPLVVSVGNICLGGSGKTPVVGQLAADLAAGGLVVGILTRGFGARRKGPVLVDTACAGCGDEARMLASRADLQGVMIVQSAKRAAGYAFMLAQKPNLDCIILEDGFQTPDLGRHLDILLLDAWETDTQGRLLPLGGPVLPRGPWREPVTAAGRADALLVEDFSAVPQIGPARQPVFSFSRHSQLVAPEGSGVDLRPGEPWAAVSGVARPQGFEATVTTLMQREPTLVVRGRDHESYSAKTLRTLERALAERAITTVVTTAKDWVKLSGQFPECWHVLLVAQNVEWGGAKTLPELVQERLCGQAEGGRLI